MESYEKFLDALRKYEDTPPNNLWDSIEDKTTKSVWRSRAVSTVAILLFSFSLQPDREIAFNTDTIFTTVNSLLKASGGENHEVEEPFSMREISSDEKEARTPQTLSALTDMISGKQCSTKNSGILGLTEKFQSLTESVAEHHQGQRSTEFLVNQDSTENVDQPEEDVTNGESDLGKLGEDAKKEGDNKNELYFLFMPTLSYYEFIPNRDDAFLVGEINKVSRSSFQKMGVRLEAGFQHSISNRMKATFGILYLQRNQQFRVSYENHNPRVSLKGQATDSDVIIIDSLVTFNLRNVGVTAGVQYRLKQKKWTYSIGMAVEVHKNLYTKNTPFVEDPSLYLFYDFFCRAEYVIGNKFKLEIQPTLNRSLRLQRNFETPLYVKPYGIGLNVGVVYRLGLEKKKKH